MPEQRLMERIAKVLSSGNFSMGCRGGGYGRTTPADLEPGVLDSPLSSGTDIGIDPSDIGPD